MFALDFEVEESVNFLPFLVLHGVEDVGPAFAALYREGMGSLDSICTVAMSMRSSTFLGRLYGRKSWALLLLGC